MIDYVKFQSRQPGLAAMLRAHPALQWVDRYDRKGNKTGLRASYNALTWVVFDSGFVEVTGSLHKCWNSLNGRDAANWNDFRRLDLFDVLNWLQDEMSVDLHTATVHRVEFGVNLTLPPAPPTVRDLLTRLLRYGMGQLFEEKPVDRGYYKRFDSSDFYVKAYDKGTQYNTPDQRLRFEKGVTAMKNINGARGENIVVVTLADLNNPARLDQLGTLLSACFDNCFWAEDFTGANLTPDEKTMVDEAHDPAHVASLKYDQRSRLKADYKLLTHRLDYSLKADLRTRIKEQWAYLLEDECKVLRRGVSESVQGFTKGSDYRGLQDFTHLDKGVKPYTDSLSNSPSMPTQTGSVFPDDNVVKSGESQDVPRRPTASQLRADDELLARVEQGRRQYAKGSKESREERAAHLLRNDESNPRHNRRNSLKRSINKIYRHPVFFDVSGTLRLNDEQRGRLDK